MPSSTREAALAALHAQIAAALPSVTVDRNDLTEVEIGAGQVTVFDGDPGEPEQTFSPPQWHWEHQAVLEVKVEGRDPSVRTSALDQLLISIDSAIATDHTLGGAVDYAQVEGLEPDQEFARGGGSFATATVSVLLHYTSNSPLG